EKHVQVVPRVVENEEQLAHGGNQPGYRRATLSLGPEFFPQCVNESGRRSKSQDLEEVRAKVRIKLGNGQEQREKDVRRLLNHHEEEADIRESVLGAEVESSSSKGPIHFAGRLRALSRVDEAVENRSGEHHGQ